MGAPAMEFGILGPVEVWDAGRSLPLGGGKQRALLAILLIQANQVIASQRLIDLIWPDEPPDTADHSLQVYVSQLRKVLEPEHQAGTPYSMLISQPPGYLIRVAVEDLDLGRFMLLVEEGRRSMAEGDPQVASTRFGQALGLWRGPALADFAAQPFAMGEIQRLTELRLRVQEDRIEAELALGNHADIVGELELLVAQHPLREGFSRQLMLALYRADRQAEASGVYQRARGRLVEELGMEPGPDLQELLKQILNQSPQLNAPPPPERPTPPPPGRLPTPLTHFIGREAELDEVCSLLASTRLISVLGIGGVGKTRLAVQVATRIALGYKDGVRYVDLASLSTADLLPQAVLSALGLRDQSSEDVVLVIVNHIASRQLLLLLDNCEHVAEACARLVETVLMLCPGVRVLATTRERLGVNGESVYRLQGLPFGTDSVSLFLDRARAVASSFDPTPEHVGAIRQICERLEGIPLAIELATARLTLMTPGQILQRLDRRFELLTTGPRIAAERQQTLAATIEWSYGLLTDEEQRLFRRLSVCRGWFAPDAVDDVCGRAEEFTDKPSDILGRLVDKSMVVPGTADKLGRCRMLETVREFAAMCLERAAEVEASARRHADHYLSVVENAAPHVRTLDQRRWLDWLDEEYDNIRVALEWSLASDPMRGLSAAAALGNFWFRGRQTEGRYWISRLLHATEGESGRARADALYVASWLGWMQADYDSAQRSAEELITISTRAGDKFNRGRGRRYLALLAHSRDDRDLAEHHFGEAIPDLRSAGTPWELGLVLNDYSLLLRDLGRTREARETLDEAVALAQESADPWLVGMITESAAMFAMLDGNLLEAQRLWSECLRIEDHVGDQWAATYIVDGLARLAVHEGQAERALCLLGASSSIRASMGSRPVPVHQRVVDDVATRARALLDSRTAEDAWERGRGLSWVELIGYALAPY